MSPDGSAPPNRLIFLHGFTQTHHHWHRCADLISTQLPGDPARVFVDLPGHGLSDRDQTPLASAGERLTQAVGSGTFIGYSMGARFGLFVALLNPRVVHRLVLIGANPGIEHDAERHNRIAADNQRADRIIKNGVEPFLDEWLAAPMFASLNRESARVDHRLRNSPTGLAHSLRTAGTGAQPNLWERLPELEMPVLVLAGERDQKFCEIGKRIVDELPNGSFALVSSSGHSTPAEQPDQTASHIATWLQNHPIR
jgi:2-succinyl-6-hydroxy-2,4-cyclohexadiene-1-carboxylate synthase